MALYRRHVDTVASPTEDDRNALVWLEAVDRVVLFIAHPCGNRTEPGPASPRGPVVPS